MSRWAALVSLGLAISVLGWPSVAVAFGTSGTFFPRPLLVGEQRIEGLRRTAPSRWAAAMRRRTSAPTRLNPAALHAADPGLLAEPFVYWFGSKAPDPMSTEELLNVRKFLDLGGVMFVDDTAPAKGAFGKAARRELARVLPGSAVVKLDNKSVLFRSYYLLTRPVGRVKGPDHLIAIMRHGLPRVIFSSHDVAGALAASPDGLDALDVVPDGSAQREMAIRFAVNVGMYALCSDYKDDQVHAPALMRRRPTVLP